MALVKLTSKEYIATIVDYPPAHEFYGALQQMIRDRGGIAGPSMCMLNKASLAPYQLRVTPSFTVASSKVEIAIFGPDTPCEEPVEAHAAFREFVDEALVHTEPELWDNIYASCMVPALEGDVYVDWSYAIMANEQIPITAYRFHGNIAVMVKMQSIRCAVKKWRLAGINSSNT